MLRNQFTFKHSSQLNTETDSSPSVVNIVELENNDNATLLELRIDHPQTDESESKLKILSDQTIVSETINEDNRESLTDCLEFMENEKTHLVKNENEDLIDSDINAIQEYIEDHDEDELADSHLDEDFILVGIIFKYYIYDFYYF